MNDLRPYQAELASARATLKELMGRPDSLVDLVAVARATYDLMAEQLLRWPQAVLDNFDGQADPQTGARSEKYWRAACLSSSRKKVMPLEDPDLARAYRRRYQDYVDLGIKVVQQPFTPPVRSEDNVNGNVYLVHPNRALGRQVMPVVASELMKWVTRHPVTQEFVAQPVERGWFEFLLDRPDVVALLRLVDDAPPDVTGYNDPSVITAKAQTAAQALVEIAIAFVPLLGEAVAAYEFIEGKDLFGNSLGTIDRAVLGGSILLPMAGMLIKDARPVYTETRLALTYGGKADEWAHAIESVGRLEANDLRLLGQAEQKLLVSGQRLEPALARQVAGALPGLAKPAGLLQSTVDKAIVEATAELRRSNAIMATLDEYAVRRLLEKGPFPDLIKGQLLEELIETRLVPWLTETNGYLALGLDKVIPRGSTVVYVPGHMITDIDGRLLTDGILGHWVDDELHIVVVFEAKAGKSAARELRVSKGGRSSLSETEKAGLRAEANRRLRTLQRRAQLDGTTYTGTLSDLEEEVYDEIRFSEAGGQIRRDVERLDQDIQGRPARIWIGDLPRPVPVRISATNTRFFGVIPVGFDTSLIEADLKGMSYAFEVIRAAVSTRELRGVSDRLTPLAQRLLSTP